MNDAFRGALAGAAGTMALDVASYTDMAVRGRAPSSMMQTSAQKLAEKLGIESLAAPEPDETTKNRQTATGSLLGYAVGIGAGVVYGVLRPQLKGKVPLGLAAVAVGLGVMALTDVSATVLGAADPKSWKPSDWLSDVIPHLIYGFETAYTFEALADLAN
ncbi:MAG: hypothetical protein NVSMB64_11430 [Candidatus Velthaea sp.]